MPQINGGYFVPDNELMWQFARSGGPGGQNVNKVASKAILRWLVTANTSLPEALRGRLLEQQRKRLTDLGELLFVSQRFRDQAKNREDCLAKLAEVIRQAAIVPKKRKPTKATRGSKERRLEAKRHQAKKRAGRRVSGEW